MTPHIHSDTAASTNGRDNLPEWAPAQQNKMAKSGHQEYRPKETRYNQMMHGDRQLKRPREERKLVPVVKQEKVYRPEKGFRKIERCYLMPMGSDYKVRPYEMQYYKPSPHQPTYTQRQLRPLRDTPYKPYQVKRYRLTENNYRYGLFCVSQPKDDAHSSAKEDVQNTGKVVPVGGVAVLPPVLGATPKTKPEPKPRVERTGKSTSAMWIGHFPMPKRFDGNGMYIVRDYHYTPRNFRYDKHPRYREYNQKPLPYRKYNHELVYVGHQTIGDRIQKRQFESAPVKRAPPVQQPKAAPVPIIAPVVIPAAAAAAKTPPAKEEEPVPEDPQEEPQENPGKEPEESSPQPHSGVIAGAALGGAALGGAVAATAVAATNNPKPPTPAPRKTTPTPQPAVQPKSSNQSVSVSTPVAAAVTGAVAGAAVGAAAAPQAANPLAEQAKPQAAKAAPQAAAPAAPPQATQDTGISGALGSIQRSLGIFG